MRYSFLFVCLIIAGFISGCASIVSPASWGWGSAGTNTPSVAPNELMIGESKTSFSSRLKDAQDKNDFKSLLDLISDTKFAISAKKTDVKATLDEASGGNYGWGILGAGAAIANLSVSVLKGLAFAGGMHVALSTRLSPKDQLTTLTDTINKLECVASVARNNDAATKAVADATKATTNSYKQHISLYFANVNGDKPNNLSDYYAAIQNILYSASNKFDSIYLNALSNNSISTDLVTSTNTLVTKLQNNAALAAGAASGVVANTPEMAVVDASKNAANAAATATVQLAACQI
jgi:hypothetical protein